MTFMELRAAIIEQLNKASNLSTDEVYGVITSIEAEVRLGYMGVLKNRGEENKAEGGSDGTL